MGDKIKGSRLWQILRYEWPLHFILWLLNGLPDNVAFLRLRGWAVRPFFGSCGKDLRLGRSLDIYNPSKIEFGNHVYIAFGCALIADASIVIKDEVILGPYVVAVSSNHSRDKGSFRYGTVQAAPIHIHQGCWLGAHVTVTAGCEIGAGSLIAAGAVVAGDIPANVLAGGVPAKIIKPLEDDAA